MDVVGCLYLKSQKRVWKATLLDGWASADGVSWSPDGKWLASAMEDLDFNSEVYIHKADNSIEPINVSMPQGDATQGGS